jgi:asparagine synthase (glutamine-hydrolysing)
MFALGVWDDRQQRLLLARDRLGEKPLYYTRCGDEFLFASEIKALLLHPAVKRAVNHDALPLYLALGYTPSPDTLFEGIHKLAPGQYLVLEAGQTRTARYWSPVMNERTVLSYPEAVAAVQQALTEAVEMRLMSDVPLGAFLSGGTDSTAVVALMARAMGRPVQTFTVGFDLEPGSKADRKFNVDARFAALASQRLGTDHHAITIRQGAFVAELFPQLIYHMDEPIAQPTIIQTAFVAALARANGVPVLLSGDSSDELFAGYPAYRADRMLARYLRIPALLRKAVLTPLLKQMPARLDSLRKLGEKSQDTDPVRRYLTWMKINDLPGIGQLLKDSTLAANAYGHLERVLAPLLAAPHTAHFADRIAFTSLNTWIAEDSNMRVDKMSMAMSVESRAPFEDHKLVELALHLPLSYKLRDGDVKRVLKDAVRDMLPAEILQRPKWGFFPPASEWLRTILHPLVQRYLSPDYVEAVGIFDAQAVSQLVKRHVVEKQYELWPLWSLLVFHLWYAIFIDGSLRFADPINPLDVVSAQAVENVL